MRLGGAKSCTPQNAVRPETSSTWRVADSRTEAWSVGGSACLTALPVYSLGFLVCQGSLLFIALEQRQLLLPVRSHRSFLCIISLRPLCTQFLSFDRQRSQKLWNVTVEGARSPQHSQAHTVAQAARKHDTGLRTFCSCCSRACSFSFHATNSRSSRVS